MRDFKKSGSFGKQRGENSFARSSDGRPNFNSHSQSNRGRDGGFGRPQLFDAICANCGRDCQVPFRPSGERPVYCKDCFGKQSHSAFGSGSGNFPRKDFPSRSPFRPSSPQGQGTPDRRIDEIKKQLDTIGAKLDRLLNASLPVSNPLLKNLVAEATKIGEAKEVKPLKISKKKTKSKK